MSLDPQPIGPLPTANDIFKRYIAAIGGEAAIRKHTSMVTKGTVGMPGGTYCKVEISTQEPNKVFATIQVLESEKYTEGFDGVVNWSISPNYKTSLDEYPILGFLKDPTIFLNMYEKIDPSKIWNKAETNRAVIFCGVPCYEIMITVNEPNDGALYYEIQSAFLRGTKLPQYFEFGKQTGYMPATTIMSDYKEFDGIKIATTTLAISQRHNFVVDSVDFAPVDPAIFNLPPEIKSLVDEKNKPSTSGGMGRLGR